MVKRRKIIEWGVVAFAAALITVFAMPTYRQGEASLAGKTAKNFSLEYQGRPAKLSDFRGKVVILNFWASWCPPCVEETPALNRLQQHVAARNGVVLGVSADSDPAAYERFLKKQSVAFPTWRDPNSSDNKSPIALEYGTSMIPETYVIDRKGKIARKVAGPQQWDSPEMLAYFDSLLSRDGGS